MHTNILRDADTGLSTSNAKIERAAKEPQMMKLGWKFSVVIWHRRVKFVREWKVDAYVHGDTSIVQKS